MSKVTTKRRSRKDFPLTVRGDGRYQKKVNGRTFYFTGTQQEALDEWLRVKDDILAGHDPRARTGELTIRDLVNAFLAAKQDLVDSGELTERSWRDYHATCGRIAQEFGRTRLVETLNADDFATFRKHLAKGRGPVTLRNDITRIHVVFKFAEDHNLVEHPIRGIKVALKKPSKAVLRKHRESNGGEELFTSEQIRALLRVATPQFKAMLLLAVGNALGNSDVANLQPEHVDLEGGWLTYPRPKTGIKRRSKLWPETIVAIRAVGLPLHTKFGGKWVNGSTSDNAISKEFRALLNDCGITTRGMNFYRMRHTFRTVADETKDQPAIDLMMGHARDDMASNYRHGISDARLEDIAAHVHDWLFAVEQR